MSWPVLTWRDRAMLHNALRDVEEIAYRVMENVKPEWKRIKADVAVTSSGVYVRIDEVPAYSNIADALIMVRDLLRLILEVDEEEKVIAVNGWWSGTEKGEKEEEEEEKGE